MNDTLCFVLSNFTKFVLLLTRQLQLITICCSNWLFIVRSRFITEKVRLINWWIFQEDQRLRKMKLFQRIGMWGASLRRRQISTTPKRSGDDHHDVGGVPGKNLPFDITHGKLLILKFGLYLGSGFATPFLLMRHHLIKKNLS